MKFLTECKFVMKIPTKQLKKLKNTKLIFFKCKQLFYLRKNPDPAPQRSA